MGVPAEADGTVGFVLVHGAGFDVWIWEALVSRMQAPTLSATFPARESEQAVRDDLRLPDYTDAVTEQVEAWEPSRVILVAHSIGGAVCMEVAARLGDRLAGFVGLSAAIPEPGQSFLSCFPFHQRVVQQAILRFAGTRPPERIIRGSLCAEVTDEQADRVVDEFVPESRYLYTDPVDGILPAVETRYIRTGTDKSITPDQQTRMITTLGTNDVVTLDTGHLPMLSCPGELATALEAFRSLIE